MRERIEAAIKDAYYAARDSGGTMHTAATDATDAVLAVLAEPDEATVERLAALFFSWESPTDWSTVGPVMGNIFRQRAHEALAALAGTSAQARHTDDDVADKVAPARSGDDS